jgi:ubiquinone/menaquinone biosynthesis C-methylase UbiE
MKTTSLGLPYEYQKYPEFFDALNINEHTEEKNALIESLLKQQNVKTVLDLTCGTGSQVFYLAKQDYEIIGADFSPDLIKIARKRARAEKVNVKFIDGDMRNLQVGTFDAVITIFNAVGHLTKTGFEKAMRNIYKNLKPGGVYIFDILNLEAMNDQRVADLSWHVYKKLKDVQIHTVQYSVIDRAKGRLTAYDTVVTQRKVNKPESFNSKFSLQIYSAKELKDMLVKSGFKTLAQYDMDGSTFSNKKSTSILTVAQKI